MTNKTVSNPPRDSRIQFFIFVFSGGFSSLCSLSSRIALSWVFPYEVAVAIAYVIGMVIAFILFQNLVFEKSEGSQISQYYKFVIVNGISFTIVVSVSSLLYRIVLPYFEWTWHSAEISHIIGQVSPVFVSFYAHKKFTFK